MSKRVKMRLIHNEVVRVFGEHTDEPILKHRKEREVQS